VDDSQHLLLEWFDTIYESPSQVYHLALKFCPSSSWLHKYYATELSQEVKVVRGVLAEWGMCYRTVMFDKDPWALTCWKDIIAVGLGFGEIITLHGITGSQTAILSGHTDNVVSLAFSPDGTSLVSGSHDKTIKLWDLQTGGVIKTFYGHTNQVLSVSILADCTRIASGSADKTIRLWDTQAGNCHHIIEQQHWVYYVQFSPTYPWHFISESSGKVQLWDINGHQINPIQDGSSATLSPDGTQIILCSGRDIVVKNIDSGAIVAKFCVPKYLITQCCFSLNGRLIAVAVGNTAHVWDITSSDPHPIKTFVGHAGSITSLAFSSLFSLVTSCNDQSVKFWQIGAQLTDSDATDPMPPSIALPAIVSITLHAKDGIAISCDVDKMVRTWDISTGLCNASFQTPAKDSRWSDVRLVDKRLIFVWCVDEKIYTWDVEKQELLHTADIPKDGMFSVKISEDGSRVFCLCGSSITAWSIQTGEVVGRVGFELDTSKASLIVDGSRVWVHSPQLEPLGWDFGIPGPPIQLDNAHLLYPKLWGVHQSKIKDTVTGRVMFQLAGRFANPEDSQWDGQYLVAGYWSGEVLILDFNRAFF